MVSHKPQTLLYKLIINHFQETKMTILYMHVVIMCTDIQHPLYNFKYLPEFNYSNRNKAL